MRCNYNMQLHHAINPIPSTKFFTFLTFYFFLIFFYWMVKIESFFLQLSISTTHCNCIMCTWSQSVFTYSSPMLKWQKEKTVYNITNKSELCLDLMILLSYQVEEFSLRGQLIQLHRCSHKDNLVKTE